MRGLSSSFSRNICAYFVKFHDVITGKAPLHLCAFEGDAKMARALLDCGADVNIPDDNGKMAIHWAVARNNADVVRVLCDGGANVESKTKNG